MNSNQLEISKNGCEINSYNLVKYDSCRRSLDIVGNNFPNVNPFVGIITVVVANQVVHSTVEFVKYKIEQIAERNLNNYNVH